ncbi:MAG: response regulator [Treponema sp.]|nr:response regulator [Treponema sp.]
MTILIADDDKNIRFALKSMLCDILDDTTSIDEARTGTEFVNMCMENPPDAAFVDIQMPELDGISAIALAKQYAQTTRFIVLTGYSNFEYARKCVPLGVLDYLLKPVNTEELKAILGKVQQQINDSHKLEQSLFQTKVLTFAHYYPYIGGAVDIPDDVLPHNLLYVVCSFMFIFAPSARQSFPGFRHEFMSNLNSCAAASFGSDSVFSVYFTESGHMSILIRTTAENAAERITSLSKKSAENTGSGSVAVKAVYQTASTLREAFIKSADFEKIQYRMLLLRNGALEPADVLSSVNDEFLQQIWNIHEQWDANSESEYKNEIKIFSDKYRELPKSVPLSGILTYFQYAFDETHSMNLNSWSDCLHILQSLTFCQESGSCGLIEQVKTFIDKNYMNNLGINQIADQYTITPNYLSALFHRKTGVKLLDYITNLRMEYAKKLLKRNPNTSVKDISIMTGYSNPRYFSMLFKNYTGMLPTQYRKS